MSAINREQRDLMRTSLLLDLYGIDELNECIRDRDDRPSAMLTAQRLGQRYQDDMRLLDDLGWVDDDDRGEFPLTLPDDQLTRVLLWLLMRAREQLNEFIQGAERPMWLDVTENDLATRDVHDAAAEDVEMCRVCAALLAGLEAPAERVAAA